MTAILHSITAFTLRTTGGMPNWALLAWALVVLLNSALRKTGKIKADDTVELIFNQANKLLLPILGKIPVIGPTLAVLDTPGENVPAPPAPPPPPTLPPTIKAAMLIPFLFLLNGCAGAKALGACELNALPQTLETTVVDVVNIAYGGTDVNNQLLALGAALAPGQLACAVQAVNVWLKAKIPAHGEASPQLIAAVQRLEIFLSTHKPTACDNRFSL